MKRKDRRKTDRHPAGWIARYSPDHSHDGWARCEVVDVSEAGACLVLSGAPVEPGTWLTLELPAGDGTSDDVQVKGIVRHTATSPDGTMHIGVEFSGDESAVVVVKITDELGAALAGV
jgi:hypothetical protein